MTCWDFRARLHEAQIPLRVCKCCGVFISPPSVSVSTFESGSWDIRETICSQWPINACHVTPATHKNTFNVTVRCLYGFKARVHGWQTLCFSGLQDDLYGFPPFSLSPSVSAWSTHVGSVTAVLRLQCVWAFVFLRLCLCRSSANKEDKLRKRSVSDRHTGPESRESRLSVPAWVTLFN